MKKRNLKSLYILFIGLWAIFPRALFAGEIDSVIYHRLKMVEQNIVLNLNEEIQAAIHAKMYTNRTESEMVLSRSLDVIPVIEKMLWERNLPSELKYLPAAVSNLNPLSVSTDGGAGIWNLQYITAKRYGLRINEYIDERKDLMKSTAVALRYLKDLDAMYHNWNLNVLAFLSSPSEVNAAMNRAGSSTDFGAIYAAIQSSGKTSYAQFVASTYLINFHQAYDLRKQPLKGKITTKPVLVKQPLHLADLAYFLKVGIDEIRMANPMLIHDVYTPQTGVSLFIPSQSLSLFAAVEDSVYRRFTNGVKPVVHPSTDHATTSVGANESGEKVTVKVNEVKFYHKVEKGETLYKIAQKYNLSIDDIRRWNNLPRETIFMGQKLVLYKSQPTVVREIEKPVTQTTVNPVTSEVKTTTTNTTSTKPSWVTYKVKSGDSLWKIANKFNVSEADIKKVNKIQGSKIFPGQVLKIKKR